ncbi:hypothetical protein [Chitinimonas sp.]|uniref:hypothetical protein n=1 Tax=Chitinimonas sp. TaxID=1934313 RepID=UPI0035B4F825
MFKKILPAIAAAVLLMPAYAAVASANVSGSATKPVITAQTTIPAGEAGQAIGAVSVYVAALVGDQAYFKDAKGNWVPYTGKQVAAYASMTPAPIGDVKIDVLDGSLDVAALKGTKIIIGWGKGAVPFADPFADMLNNLRFSVVHTL